MINHIFPADTRGRKLLFLSLFFIGYLYLLRVDYTHPFLGMMGTWLSAFFFLTPIFWFMGLMVHVIFVSFYVFKSRGHFSLGLFLVGGLLLARFLPLPPTPEEVSFSWQRAKYDQIVELARRNQLQHGKDCLAKDQFLPPADYYQWSGECISVRQREGIVVEFVPRSLQRPIIYLENPTGDKVSRACWNEGNDSVRSADIFLQLSEHWYICKRWFRKER